MYQLLLLLYVKKTMVRPNHGWWINRLILALFWFANVRLLSEFSTPFVNLRWILNQLNLRQSRIYDLNRKITFYAFLFFRIIPIPIYWSVAIYNYRTQTFSNLDIPLKTILLVSGIALDILNINWFGKLSKGSKHG